MTKDCFVFLHLLWFSAVQVNHSNREACADARAGAVYVYVVLGNQS